MSKTYIPKDVQHEVWWKAAGRCEFKGCNKPLYKHGITLDKCKISELAHIIGDSENGPRGDKDLSKALAKDPKNIMLLCSECHKYIDNEGKDKYTAEMLFDMKKRHEDRIAKLTSSSARTDESPRPYTLTTSCMAIISLSFGIFLLL